MRRQRAKKGDLGTERRQELGGEMRHVSQLRGWQGAEILWWYQRGQRLEEDRSARADSLEWILSIQLRRLYQSLCAGHCLEYVTNIDSLNSQHNYKVGIIIIILILQMRELRHKDISWLAQGPGLRSRASVSGVHAPNLLSAQRERVLLEVWGSFRSTDDRKCKGKSPPGMGSISPL